MPVSLRLETKHEGEKGADPTRLARYVGRVWALAAVAAKASTSTGRERESLSRILRPFPGCCSSFGTDTPGRGCAGQESFRGERWRHRPGKNGVPTEIRTLVTAVKGRRPGPLDDGDAQTERARLP